MTASSEFSCGPRFAILLILSLERASSSFPPPRAAERPIPFRLPSLPQVVFDDPNMPNLPSFRSLQDPAQLEEERRLLYVAMTRAKQDLYLIKPNLDDPTQYYGTGSMAFSQICRFITPDMVDCYFDQWSLGVGDIDSDPTDYDSRKYSF